jgi:nitroreductase
LNQEEHQTKIAGAHMALAALEHGVGSCWVSRFDVLQLARTLGLPPEIRPGELLVFGYPAGQAGSSSRKDLSELVFYNQLSNIRPAG